MRRLLVAACAAFLGFASPALADDLTTTTNVCYGSVGGCFLTSRALQPFDSSLGTLTGITLQVDGTMANELIVRPTSTTPGTLTLGYDGTMTVVVNGVSYSFDISAPQVDFTVSGATVFADTFATGTGIFQVDPLSFSSFTDGAHQCDFGVGICAQIPSGQLGIADVFEASNNVSISPIVDFYNQAIFTLTYSYTPAIPEPSTWAMMLLGFAAIGFRVGRGGKLARGAAVPVPTRD
jgi:hypothetical protein